MHPRHLEMATSAALEAEGRAPALSAKQTENWSYTQEMGRMAVKENDTENQLVPSHKVFSYSKITKWQVARPKIHIQSALMDCCCISSYKVIVLL